MPFLFLINCKLPLCIVNWLLHVNSCQPVEGQPIWLSEFFSSKLCGTSIQVDDTEVINFLLSTEIIPLCLRTMEMGSELSKTVS
jgi:CCR4-NOT transcription complex subunit 9